MPSKLKTSKEIITTSPGAFHRRHEIIKALCSGTNMANVGIGYGFVAAKVIVDAANAIIEATEQ